jgi:hypothetical protein
MGSEWSVDPEGEGQKKLSKPESSRGKSTWDPGRTQADSKGQSEAHLATEQGKQEHLHKEAQ